MTEPDHKAVLIFTKTSRVGQVKTRLVGKVISEADATRLHTAFLQDTVHQAIASQCDFVIFSLTDIHPIRAKNLHNIEYFDELEMFQNDKIIQSFHIQPNTTFAERMKDAIVWVFSNTEVKELIILGADSPQIQPSTINTAFEYLKQVDIVLGPSSAGGIYLIGLRSTVNLDGFENVFDTVELVDFTKYISDHQYSATMLHELVDIDVEEDLISLIAWIAAVDNLKGIPLSQAEYTRQILMDLGLTIGKPNENNREKQIYKT